MMSRQTVLLADNDHEYVTSIRPFLAEGGYRVIAVHTPEEAVQVLQRGNVDLALIDIRLRDDKDELDRSGLQVAHHAPDIPKIIVTNYPTYEAARAALTSQANGHAPAVDIATKHDGPEKLLLLLNHISTSIRLRALEARETYFATVRVQANVFFWLSIAAAITGFALLGFSVYLAVANNLTVDVMSVTAGLVIEAVSVLFYQQANRANQRVDEYQRERIENERVKRLLDACEEITDDEKRNDCIRAVIDANKTLFSVNSPTTNSLATGQSTP